MDELVSSAEALWRILQNLPLLGTEKVPLADAVGRVLREPIQADRPLPPYRRATMDGIAFHSSSGSRLKIAGLHPAGDPPPPRLNAGEAWEIMTGAVVPDDCDTLVPYEEVTIGEGVAGVNVVLSPGKFIHETGSDAEAGKTLVPLWFVLGPVEVAIAASVGMSELMVSKRPVITLLTTGDEAVPVENTPESWQIRRSNGPMLEAVLKQAGYDEIHSCHVSDDVIELERSVDRALSNSHVLLLCGGISKGKRDYVRGVIDARLGAPSFHGVAQRPGKPLAFWNGPPFVFALPGNPVSVLATFTRYVRPALIRIQGGESPSAPFVPLASEIRPARLTWFVPAVIHDGRACPLPPKNSGDFVALAGATHLLEIPSGEATLPAGHLVVAHSLF